MHETSTLRLYQFDQAIADVIERSDLADGELTDIDAELLDELQMAKADKVRNIIALIQSYRARASESKEVAKRASDIAARLAAKEEWLKAYLARNCEGEKYQTPYGNLSWRKSTAVVIDDESELRLCYLKRIPEQLVPDKTAIKKAIDSGDIVRGAHVEERNSIQISK